MRWAERWHRLRSETDALERRVAGKTSSIARTFDKVCAVLDELGYLSGEQVTGAGEQLARVYSESDLLAVESMRAGLWDDLGPAELAAVVSSLVYSSRRADESNPVVPSGAPPRCGPEGRPLRVGRCRFGEGASQRGVTAQGQARGDDRVGHRPRRGARQEAPPLTRAGVHAP